MADVTELFGSTSLTTPRAAPVVPAAASEAAASMLLIGILTDLAALKQAMVEQQGAVYRAFNDFATEQLAINAGLVESGRHQIAVNGHQADSNAAQNVCNAEVGKLFDMHNKLVEHTNKLALIIAEIDDRLYALDGKRSIVLSPPPVAEDHEARTE